MILLPGLLRLFAPAWAGECIGTPPAALAERLKDALAVGDHAGAVAAVHAAEPTFVCLDVFVTSDDLVAVYQLAGTAAFFDGREDEAAALYRRAVIVRPNAVFDAKDLREDARPLYERVHGEVTGGPTGTLVPRDDVVIDGDTVQVGSSMVVYVGLHLVQENREGRVVSSLVSVEPGGRVGVGTPDPNLVAAERTLFQRRKATFLVGGGALLATSAGLFAAAVAQESRFHELDPEQIEDPELFAVQAQQRINGCTLGGLLAAGLGIGVGWHGFALRLTLDGVQGPGAVGVSGTF